MDELHHLQRQEIGRLHERIRQLEDVLMPPSVVVPLEYRLTTTEARVYAHLASRDMGTKQSIMMALYSDRPTEEPEIKIVDVFICKMRKKLARFGVHIETVWGQGYRVLNRPRAAGGSA